MGANEHRCWKENEKWQRPVAPVAVVFVIAVKAITVVVGVAAAAGVADGVVVAVTVVAAAAAAADVEPLLSRLPSFSSKINFFTRSVSRSRVKDSRLLCLLLSELHV